MYKRVGAMLMFLASPLWAAEVDVQARPGALVSAIRAAAPGDVLRLAPGVYAGPVVIDRQLVLRGDGQGAVVDGGGLGSVILVLVPDVTIRGLTIRGSGSSHESRDAGIRLGRKARNARIEGNHLTGNLYGVDVHGAHDAMVIGNVIDGRRDHRVNDRGNGVYVWNAPGTVVAGNDMRWGRDGIFVNASKRNVFRGNRFRDLRFAVHYMYADDSEVSGNLSVGNDLGFALMYSKRLRVTGNVSISDREHGIMLNYTNQSVVEGNLVRDGGNRCAFLYNAHKNRIEGNRFARCAIGIHFTAGSERNRITGNAFVGNRTQVKYVGSRWLDWSVDGRGNYWSDLAAYDVDGNGIADATYRPNDSMDHVLWSQPAARLLLGSPAVQLMRWAQSEFPALLPGGVVDRHPLMHPPDAPDTAWGGLGGG